MRGGVQPSAAVVLAAGAGPGWTGCAEFTGRSAGASAAFKSCALWSGGGEAGLSAGTQPSFVVPAAGDVVLAGRNVPGCVAPPWGIH
jgi:hypothetical protein